VCAQHPTSLQTWHCSHLLLTAVLLWIWTERRPRLLCSNQSISPGRRAHSSKPAARRGRGAR